MQDFGQNVLGVNNTLLNVYSLFINSLCVGMRCCPLLNVNSCSLMKPKPCKGGRAHDSGLEGPIHSSESVRSDRFV